MKLRSGMQNNYQVNQIIKMGAFNAPIFISVKLFYKFSFLSFGHFTEY